MTWLDRRTDLDTWRLDRDWDALAAAEPASPPSPLDPSIKRFNAEGTRAEPSGVFVQQLEETLMKARLNPAVTTPATTLALAKVTTQTAPSAPVSIERNRKSWPLLDIAAMLLIAAGIVAFLVVQNGSLTLPWQNGDTDPPLQQITGGPATSGLPLTAATPAATPEVVDCTVEPRTIEEVISLVGIAKPARWDQPYERSMPTATEPVPQLAGSPAPPDIVAEIQARLDEFVVCNRRTATRLLPMAFWSEELIKGDLNQPLTSEAVVELQAIVVPHQGEPEITEIIVQRAEVRPDGRVAAYVVVTITHEVDMPPQAATIVLVREGEQWFINDISELSSPGDSKRATPDTDS